MSQESQTGAKESNSQRAPLSQPQSMILSHPPEPAKELPQAPPPSASTPLVVNRLSDTHRKRPREVESLTMFADEGMDTAEDSFDYADAMDEMERGIRDGSIPVHGSQQPVEPRRSSDRGQGRHGSAHGETQASLAAVEEGAEEGDQLPEEEVQLPPTQSTGSIPKRDREAGSNNVQKESTQQQQKKVSAGGRGALVQTFADTSGRRSSNPCFERQSSYALMWFRSKRSPIAFIVLYS